MRDEQIIEAMAGIEGIDVSVCHIHRLKTCCGRKRVPKYITDHNAVQPVIDGLSSMELARYHNTATEMARGRMDSQVHLFTPRQKCIVILTVKGLWQKD